MQDIIGNLTGAIKGLSTEKLYQELRISSK